MATALVPMQSGQRRALACRPSSSCALLLHGAPSRLALLPSPCASFIGILSSPLTSQSAPRYGMSSIQSSSQMPFDSSTAKSSPGSASTAQQSSHDAAQRSARSSTTQATPRAYDATPVAQVPAPSPLNSGYGKLEPYEDAFNNYGVPDAAVVEPWSQNASFRSGPMFGSPQPSSLNRLFVSNLASSIDDAALQELFSKFGTVLEARVLRDQESGRSRGFAVVAMSSVDETKAASNALSGWRVESHPLKVDAVTFEN